MGSLGEHLDTMTVRASSPDGQIEVELSGDQVESLSFRGNTYRHYTERTLESQLSRLAVRAWTGYQRSYDAAVSEAVGRPVERPRETWDANRRRFRQAQAATRSEGISANGWVYLETTGMVTWNFVIRDGALTEWDESGFVAEVLSAHQAMRRDYSKNMTLLRRKYYGVSFLPTKSSTK